MGLSFHYSGKIADPELLPDLIEEIRDIAITFDWKYFIFDRQFPENNFGNPGYDENIYGISFTPPGCEPIPICFLSNGRMSFITNLQLWGKAEKQEEREYLYKLSVKTQYAGVEIHQLVIQIFRYLNEKYFDDFKMTDEGFYWETNDLAVLQSTFKKYTFFIDSFVLALETTPAQTGENIESYLKRLSKLIYDRKNRALE